MPVLNAHADRYPGVEEIRAALGHMAASEAFRGCPQLIAFLRYVVEATLRGEQSHIKGYTIAVEALGRGQDFDPQTDPIVRVEATRLRRAIHRYYENGGKHDPVQIDLPLGSYVPTFRCASASAIPAEALPPAPRAAPRANWRHIALVLFGGAIYAMLDFVFDFNTPNPQPVPLFLATQSRAAPAYRAAATPVVFVGTFFSNGKNGPAKGEVDALRGKLRDALARFDELQVISGMPPADTRVASAPENAGQYTLTASLETEDARSTSLRVRLTDASDGQVAYAHTFTRVQLGHDDAIVREISSTLAQPYGIIEAHERGKEFAGAAGETPYRCLIEAHDYWRSYDPQQHLRARDCLDRITEVRPGFALGHAALAAILLEEYRSGVNVRTEDPPPLQRALAAARRAVELKPGSARAHQALADVQFARGDYPLAIEAGERAVALNPYDPNALADFGGMLVLLGEQERGARLIREAAHALAVRPAWHDFLLFLTAYLANDPAGAARYAALIAPDSYPPGLMARALVAAQRGETEAARHWLDRLAAAQPDWRKDDRAALMKYVRAEAIVDRIARDIAQVQAVPGQ